MFLPERYNRKIVDTAHIETDYILYYDIIPELESLYGQAYYEMEEIAENYLKWFVEADAEKRKAFENGTITKEEYKNWRINKMLTGRRYYAMLETLSDNLANVNNIAYNVINGYMPEVYAINGNFTAYTIEHNLCINTAFTIYNEQTIERIIRDKPNLLPIINLNIPKDKLWNKQNINSAIMQSIVLGENLDDTAKRIAYVTDTNQTSALRNAATAITSAQNGGRDDMYKRAQSMGIELGKRWIATLDGHTRASHRSLDGKVAEIGEKFDNGCEFPGDPKGAPAEIYNCRCTTVGAFADQDFSKFERNSRLGNMTYEEWKNAKGGEPLFKSARNANRDMRMHEEYGKLLGKKVPSYFRDFQDLKYNNREEWKKFVFDARKARNKRRGKA